MPTALEHLTDEQIDAMEAGADMRRLVMSIIGETYSETAQKIGCGTYPDTDMNDAMKVAERFGLFEFSAGMCELCRFQGKWRVCRNNRGMTPLVAEDRYAQVAICRAILKLARNNHLRQSENSA